MKKILAAIAGSVLMLSAVALAATAVATSVQSDPQSSTPKGGVGTSILSTYFTRGTTVMLTLNDADPPSAASHTYIIPAGQEVYAHRLKISNARFASGLAISGGVTLSLFTPDSGYTNLYYPFSAYGAQEFEFSPPLTLKESDQVIFTYTGTPATGYVQVAIDGEPIQTATGVKLN